MFRQKVSIAMATYNGEKYLPQLLDSLFAQTRVPDEIVIVDDKSSDATIEVLNAYAEKYNCIKLFVNEQNLGVNKNFEKAISLCSGDYIFICDQDDFWLPENIELKLNTLMSMPKDKCNFVCHYSILVDKNLNQIVKPRCIEYKDALDIYPVAFQGTTMAFNRLFAENIGTIPNDFKEFPYDWYIENIALNIANIHCIGKALILYRLHEKNVLLKVRRNRRFVSLLEKIFSIRRYCLKPQNLNQLRTAVGICERIGMVNDVFSCLASNCVKKGNINWISLWRIKGLPVKKKIQITLATMLNDVIEFVKR